ncbi:MAG: ABC transporter substrate-binding protein [Dehalococcoidia bacterium]|nr:ABC transporter substrate-binding protein [Dehalococcoidia bacterium]
MLALVALLAISACGGSDDEDSSSGAASEGGSGSAASEGSGSGGTLRIAMSAGNIPIPDQFLTEGGEGIRFVGVNVYDGLLNWDTAQGDHPPAPIPGLAESWEVADDDLTWTFHLRQGVKFHDGTDFNADAVVFALDRILNPDFEYYQQSQAASGAGTTAQIASYEKVDDYTVQIVTKKPWAFFIYDAAQLRMPSPTAIQTYGSDEYAKHPVGTGPFKVDVYTEGQVMELVRNEDYWGNVPKLDRIILYPMPEPATRLAALQSGQVDWAEVPPPDSVAQLEAAGFNVLLKGYPHIITYMPNLYREPMNNIKVREAIAYGIDREGMMAIINNVGIPADQYFYEGHPWRDDSFEGFHYDPERAKAALAEAGYADGLTITVAHPTGGSGNMFPGPMNEKFQQDMKAIGIDVVLAPLEWNTILSMYRAGFANAEWSDYDMLYFSPNTQAPMFAFAPYLTERIPPAGCCNPMGYSNPDADAIMLAAASEFDLEAQNELLKEFQGTFMRDIASIPVTHDLNLRVLSPSVKGWIQPQSWWGDFTSVWIEE